jgi:signal transduction histidine kinase
MLQGGKLDAAATAKALEVVVRNAKAQAELVEDLLDISRIGSGKLRLDVRPVNLGAIMENVVASQVPSARARGVRLDLTTEECDLTVQGDPGRLEQIVANLLSNAIKFTPTNGSVTVTGFADGERGECVRLVVRDTGVGIPAERLAQVFEPFVQVDDSHARRAEGSGLGLAISRDLARGMGGNLTAESDVNVGSAFSLTLPALLPA